MHPYELTPSERQQISQILERRANEIAIFRMGHKPDTVPASVDLGLEREVSRLRKLAERVNPPAPEEQDSLER